MKKLFIAIILIIIVYFLAKNIVKEINADNGLSATLTFSGINIELKKL